MQESKKFAFDISMTFVASLVNMALAYLVTILLGRYLGPSSLGLYRMNSTLYSFALVAGMVGIPAAMIKYVAEFKEDKAHLYQIVSSGVITSLVLGVVFLVTFFSMAGVFARIFRMPELSTLLRIISFVFPLTLVGGVLLGLLNGLRDMKEYNTALVLQSVLLVVVTIPLISYGLGVAGAVIGIVLSSLGYCIYLIWVSRAYLRITLHKYISTTKEMLKFGSQIFGANVVDLISYRADIILTGYFLTAADVGYYTAAVGLSQFFWLIPNAIQRITYPATSEYWAKKNQDAIQVIVDRSMKYSACIMLPVALVAVFYGKEIITTLFGEKFIYAFAPLEVLLIGTVINGAVVRAIGSCMAGVGRPDINLKVVILSAVVGVGLNVVLIPYMGIVGAALATTLTLSLTSVLLIFFTIHILDVHVDFAWFGKISVMTLVSVAASRSLEGLNQYAMEAVILCVYVAAILRWLLTKEDRRYFAGVLRETGPFLKDFLRYD